MLQVTKRQRGVTLFELLLVLFVAAFVAVAVATIYNRVNTTFKENALFNDTQQLAANIRSVYGAQSNYDGIGTVDFPAAGLAPAGMTNSSKQTVHSFSSETGSWSVGIGSNDEEFGITLNNLPTEVAVSMASKGLGVADKVECSGTSITNVSAAVTSCTGGSVTLIYN